MPKPGSSRYLTFDKARQGSIFCFYKKKSVLCKLSADFIRYKPSNFIQYEPSNFIPY